MSTTGGSVDVMEGKTLKEYCLTQIALKARIKHRENSLKHLSGHLKNGTFPKRMKSIKPYPKMDTPQAQTIVNEACQQVDKVILGQMVQDQAMKLKQDQDSYEALRKQQQEGHQQRKAPKTLRTQIQQHASTAQHPKTSTIAELQRELRLAVQIYRPL